jgi:hypothetical protein
MATESQVETVLELLKAFRLRDIHGMLDQVTEDVDLRASAFISGSGHYEGREGMRWGFAQMERELDERHERVRLVTLKVFEDAHDEDKILALCEVTITRATGERFGSDIAYLYTMEGDLIGALATWLDHEEGLRQLGEPVEVDVSGLGEDSHRA